MLPFYTLNIILTAVCIKNVSAPIIRNTYLKDLYNSINKDWYDNSPFYLLII